MSVMFPIVVFGGVLARLASRVRHGTRRLRTEVGHRPRSGWQCGGELDLLGPGGLPGAGWRWLAVVAFLGAALRDRRAAPDLAHGHLRAQPSRREPGSYPRSLSRTTGGPAWMK